MNLNIVQVQYLEWLKIEAIKTQCYADYWVNFATSETNYNRIVTKGSRDGIEKLTKAELEKEAFDTALSHIRRLEDLQNEIKRIIGGY